MAAPGSICAGRLSIHEYFLGFQTREGRNPSANNNCTGIKNKNGQAFSRLLTISSIFPHDRTQKDQYIDFGQPKSVTPRPGCLEPDLANRGQGRILI